MKMKRADFILVGSVILLALLLLLGMKCFSPQGQEAVVRVDGVEIMRLDMGEDQTVLVNGTHTVVVKDGAVLVTSAPCRNQICAEHPAIARVGETIVCLPYTLTVTVEEVSS